MADSSGFEMRAHESTYGSFLKLLKYGSIFCFFTAFVVVLIIAS